MVPLMLGPGRRALSVLTVCALAVFTAACGMPKVALKPGATGATGSTGSLAFASCMRSHGVPDFPDPSGGRVMMSNRNGKMAINGVNLKESAAQFQTAQTACQSHLEAPTAGGAPNPKVQQAALAFGQCMRAHGLPNFPDPKVSGNGIQIQVKKSMGMDLNSPQFQAAQTACQPILSSAMSAGPGGKGVTG